VKSAWPWKGKELANAQPGQSSVFSQQIALTSLVP